MFNVHHLGICLALLALVVSAQAQDEAPPPQETQEVAGQIDAVTVYRGQAMVTRVVEVPGGAGLHELVVTNLPDRVVPGSIFAESADGVEVRSVRYRTRPISQDVRQEVRDLDQQIQEIQDEIRRVESGQQLLQDRKQYLNNLQDFSVITSKFELAKGALNAETLQNLTMFTFEQEELIADEELELIREQRELQERLSLLQREKAEITQGSTRTAREAVVFLNATQPNATLRLRYLIDSATWSPSYSARVEPGQADVRMEYFASIQQMSGEDWRDVQMTLSTATPSLVAQPPTLEPLTLQLARVSPDDARQQQAGGGGFGGGGTSGVEGVDYNVERERLVEQQRQVQARRATKAAGEFEQAEPSAVGGPGIAGQPAPRGEADADIMLNRVAGEIQVLEWFARRDEGEAIRDRDRPEDVVSVTYDLASRTSLPSRQDRQLIQIAAMPMDAGFYKMAVPVLTPHVYDEAQVTNTSDQVLLAGPVSSYVAGQFVGQGNLPTVAVGERFKVGFGIDASLRAERELMDRTETVQGGNRVVTFHYRLSLQNLREQPAEVRLLDRLPTTRDDAAVRVTLVDTSETLSEDPTYQQTDRRQGILRWDVAVPPDAVGTQAKVVEYTFRLEYDRQMTVTGMSAQR